jgi:hypothetical protein
MIESMPEDGHLLCRTCNHVLSLGWHVDGQFVGSDWLDRQSFSQGVLDFIALHFKHDVNVLDDSHFGDYLASLPQGGWPLKFFVDKDDGKIISRRFGQE